MKAHWDDYPNTGKEMLMWHLRFWAIIVGVLLIILGGMTVAKASSVSWTLGQRNLNNSVEQQPGVVNNTTCAWDADDRLDALGLGSLSSGESTSWHECLIADGTAHAYAGQVFASSEGLEMTIGWSNPDASRSLTTMVPRKQTALLCFRGPEYDNESPLLQPIEGGGVGQITDIFITVTNTSSRTVRDVRILSSIHNGECGPTRETIISAQLWWWR